MRIVDRIPVTANFRSPRRGTKLRHGWFCTAATSSIVWMLPAIALNTSFYLDVAATAANVGQDIRSGTLQTPQCLQYEDKIFSLTCGFTWNSFYAGSDYILLEANEIFNGNDFEIDLQGLNSWDGLFQIDPNVEMWENIPIIKNVHVIGGQTSYEGGFIVQSDQKNFIVDSCSSSGTVEGECGGGICGHQCSGTVLLINCWSTGPIDGTNAGGIAGRRFGYETGGGQVNITNCWSEGDINDLHNGGICGSQAGYDGGFVTITKAYSTGEIKGTKAGGICGAGAGEDDGHVAISQCYTLGKIAGEASGGITGRRTGVTDGFVEITDCYTQGDITGSGHAGGICGDDTGEAFTMGKGGGVVLISNVYASGRVLNPNAGGIVGGIHSTAEKVKITLSVHNGDPMIGSGISTFALEATRNSNNIDDIRGQIYCHSDDVCWNTFTIWKETDDLPMLLAEISPPASSTPSATITSTLTKTQTFTLTPTPTSTLTRTPSRTSGSTQTSTATMTSTQTPTSTRTSTKTAPPTPTMMASHTSSNTPTCTPSVSNTPSMTFTPSSSRTPSSTRTGTASASSSLAMTPSGSVSATPTSTRTATSSETPSSTSSNTGTSTGTVTSSFTQTPSRSATGTAHATVTSTTTSATSTASHTVTSKKTLSRTMTPSLNSTASETASISPTTKLEFGDSGGSNVNSTFEKLATDLGPILGGVGLLLVGLYYILHKRRKNRSVTKEYSTILEQYVKQQRSQVVDQNCMITDEEGKIERNELFLSSDSTGMDEEGYRGKRRVSSLAVNGRNMNPLKTVTATNLSHSMMQNIQIIESSALKDRERSSTVKIVSVKAPSISEASKRTATTKLQLARIEDIDTSGMKLIDRSVLKLRKWKAFILAEVSPMVEVETKCKAESGLNSSSTNALRRDSFIRRLAYAKKVGGDRSVIDSEARSHSLSKREVVSQRQRKKKEFHAVPRNMGQASFSKPRSNTASL